MAKKNAHIHHVDAVGSGRNRNEVDHTKLRLIALCAEHHQETHTIGWQTFNAKYKVDGIRLNEKNNQKVGDLMIFKKCKDCTDRRFNCHSYCEPYLAYREKNVEGI